MYFALYNNHFVLIKYLSRLRNNESKDNKKYYYCDFCLTSFKSNETLLHHQEFCNRRLIVGDERYALICFGCGTKMFDNDHMKEHIKYCSKFDPVKIIMPHAEPITTYEKLKNGEIKERIDPPNNFLQYTTSHMKKQQIIKYVCYCDFECILKPSENGKKIHVPVSFKIILISTEERKIIYDKLYLGYDCMDWFFEKLR